MTLTELRYVVAVARERYFGHAAEACFGRSRRLRWR
jgi:LysR family hydrogen peroxide-inducible transcriptional activator